MKDLHQIIIEEFADHLGRGFKGHSPRVGD